MAMRTIFLVRHGDYQLDEITKLDRNLTLQQHYELHAKEGGLTPTGKKQANLVAKRFSSLPIAAIHCSSLRRTLETATIIAKEFPGIKIQQSSLLWECVPSIPKVFAQHEHLDIYLIKMLINGKDRLMRRSRDISRVPGGLIKTKSSLAMQILFVIWYVVRFMSIRMFGSTCVLIIVGSAKSELSRVIA